MATEEKNIKRRQAADPLVLLGGLISRQWGLLKDASGSYSVPGDNVGGAPRNKGSIFAKNDAGELHEFLEKQIILDAIAQAISDYNDQIEAGDVFVPIEGDVSVNGIKTFEYIRQTLSGQNVDYSILPTGEWFLGVNCYNAGGVIRSFASGNCSYITLDDEGAFIVRAGTASTANEAISTSVIFDTANTAQTNQENTFTEAQYLESGYYHEPDSNLGSSTLANVRGGQVILRCPKTGSLFIFCTTENTTDDLYIYKKVPGGSWTAWSEADPNSNRGFFAPIIGRDGTIIAGTAFSSSHIYRSLDGGSTYSKYEYSTSYDGLLAGIQLENGIYVLCLGTGPDDGDFLWGKEEDRGAQGTWNLVSIGAAYERTLCVDQDPNDREIAFGMGVDVGEGKVVIYQDSTFTSPSEKTVDATLTRILSISCGDGLWAIVGTDGTNNFLYITFDKLETAPIKVTNFPTGYTPERVKFDYTGRLYVSVVRDSDSVGFLYYTNEPSFKFVNNQTVVWKQTALSAGAKNVRSILPNRDGSISYTGGGDNNGDGRAWERYFNNSMNRQDGDIGAQRIRTATDFVERGLKLEEKYFQLGNIVKVTASDFAEKMAVIDPMKIYFIDGVIDVGDFTTEVPKGGMFLRGHNYDLSQLITSENNHTIFTSPVGGSGAVNVVDVALSASGTNSLVYDLVDVDGTHEIKHVDVNFNNCTKIGVFDGYRQGLEVGTGRFGGTPEMELKNPWAGGYFIDTSIVRGLTDGAYTLFKAGAGFTMQSRFRTNHNADLNSTVSLFDFAPSNFPNKNTLQVEGAIITRNGVIDGTDSTITPNVDRGDDCSFWKGNTGIRDTQVGAKLKITTETPTSLTTNTWADIDGTWEISNNQHFIESSNGVLEHTGPNPIDFNYFVEFYISGTNNDDIEIRPRRWDGSTWENFSTRGERISNQGYQGLSRAVYVFSGSILMEQGDRIKFQVRNITSSNSITMKNDSAFRITER